MLQIGTRNDAEAPALTCLRILEPRLETTDGLRVEVDQWVGLRGEVWVVRVVVETGGTDRIRYSMTGVTERNTREEEEPRSITASIIQRQATEVPASS